MSIIRRMDCTSALSVTLVAGLVALPLAVALVGGPGQAGGAASQAQPPPPPGPRSFAVA